MNSETKSDNYGSELPGDTLSHNQERGALLAAIDEMELLLSHSTQAGIVVPMKRIEAFVKAKRAALEGTLDDQVEIGFWHEFQELGQQLKPISIDSLKATRKRYGSKRPQGLFKWSNKRSHAGQAVRHYQIWSVVALFLLLCTQIYTIFGSNAVNDIQSLSNKIEAELLKIEGLYSRVAASSPEENRRITELIREADTRLSQMNDRLEASYELLMVWFPLELDVFDPQKPQDPLRLQIAHIILESLSRYLLPLLYGLLGACVYVLRTLSLEIKKLIYTVESDIRFQLRIYLGTLAGLAIGWLITEQSAPGLLQSVTPIALAFIAGYSVELLFSAMDSIIDAFTRETADHPK